MKVLHVVQYSLPERTSGYCIRSKYIVDTQKKLGIEPLVLTRYPQFSSIKQQDAPEGGTDSNDTKIVAEECLDGVPYLRDAASTFGHSVLDRLSAERGPRRPNRRRSDRRFRRHIERAVKTYSPDLIHVASPAQNALVAIAVGRRHRLPVVYEVRGLWHDTGTTLGILDRFSEEYRTRSQELLRAMEDAHVVVTLNEPMECEFATWGIPSGKIHVVPNGVDGTRLRPREQSPHLMQKLGIGPDDTVLGYIGSIRRLEGLHWLIRVGRMLRAEDPAIKILVVGKGEALEPLRTQARGSGLDGVVSLTGPVPHGEVLDYYALIDIFVIPRIKSRVTDLVPPLKVHEAMAMGKAVLVSDVGALREIIDDGKTGLVFSADDPVDLANKCSQLIGDRDLRERLGRAASSWVLRQREWMAVVERYRLAYEKVA